MTNRKAMYVAAAVLAAGVAGIGAVPALSSASAGPGTSGPAATSAPGYGMGTGMGRGRGGGRNGGGTCWLSSDAASGTLTAQQRTTLAAMAEQEKLAHDLYQAFATWYDSAIFERVALARTRHLTAVRSLLDRYGLADPTAGKAADEFASAAVKATYDRYLREGSASLAAVLDVGERVERADIAALERALDALAAPDVEVAYQHLLMASRHHLAALTR
jgi:hypothetical protein